ncbi:hypothetical protein ART_2479 [Arthrobacter sp. PAMC 25486]|nr:hypothetical protein ART_2479 [Arthrobacter sp. PAMC 25486]
MTAATASGKRILLVFVPMPMLLNSMISGCNTQLDDART